MIVEWAKNFVSFHFFFKCLFFLLSFCVYQPYRYSYIVWADKLSQMHLVIFRDMVWDETRGSNQCSVGIPLKESRPCVDRVPQLALVNVPPKTTHTHTMLDVHFLWVFGALWSLYALNSRKMWLSHIVGNIPDI